MTTLQPDAKASQTPRITPRINYDLVCTSPNTQCDLNCENCEYYKFGPNAPHGRLGPYKFRSWDIIDTEITRIFAKYKTDFDISRWKFWGSNFWHNDLCFVPAGCLIEVEVSYTTRGI